MLKGNDGVPAASYPNVQPGQWQWECFIKMRSVDEGGGHQRSVLRRKPIVFAFPLVAEVRESSRDNDKRNRQIGRKA